MTQVGFTQWFRQAPGAGGGPGSWWRRGSPAHLVRVSYLPTRPARAVLREPQPSGLGEGRGGGTGHYF